MKEPLKGKREIVIRLLNGNTMTVWADSRERPYAQIKGRIKLRTKERTRYYCQTDHNKNVTGLADGNGTIRATWDYDAFGNCITQSGDKAEWNPVKYSSEYHDKELGLIYYNYRHYNPKDGRWISRDLIEEKGGFNLYCFVNNLSLIHFDYLGETAFFKDHMDAVLEGMKQVAEVTKTRRDKNNKEYENGVRICCCKMGYYLSQMSNPVKREDGLLSDPGMMTGAFKACNTVEGKVDETTALVHSHPRGLPEGLSDGDRTVIKQGGIHTDEFSIPAGIVHAVVSWRIARSKKNSNSSKNDSRLIKDNSVLIKDNIKNHQNKKDTENEEEWIGYIYNGKGELINKYIGNYSNKSLELIKIK